MRGTRQWHQNHQMGRGLEPKRRSARRSARRSFRRRFATREERIAHLETYLGDLRAEAQAVEERISELQAKDHD